MLAGLLHPTAGRADVLGFTPWERKGDFLRSMTLVMGQRNRLSWDIPAADSFLLNQAIYRLSDEQYKQTLKELDELLELGPIVKKPVRNLSLGERMKCELAAGLLHRPQVLFLDEPTIGLDVSMQGTVRSFIRAYNERHGASVILTSHYMDDVVALCRRVIVIDHGRIIYDGDLRALALSVKPDKRVVVRLERPVPEAELSRFGTVVSSGGAQAVVQVAASDVSGAVGRMLAALPVTDLTVEDPPLEEVMSELFRTGRPAAGSAS
jgi:ABC-2 type transport system ATP-binding protein